MLKSKDEDRSVRLLTRTAEIVTEELDAVGIKAAVSIVAIDNNDIAVLSIPIEPSRMRKQQALHLSNQLLSQAQYLYEMATGHPMLVSHTPGVPVSPLGGGNSPDKKKMVGRVVKR